MEIKKINQDDKAVIFAATFSGSEWEQLLDTAKAQLEAQANHTSCGCHDDKYTDHADKPVISQEQIFDAAVHLCEPVLYKNLNTSSEYLDNRKGLTEWPLIEVKHIDEKELALEIAFDFYPEIVLPNFDELRIEGKKAINIDVKDVEAELQTLIDRSKKAVEISTDRGLEKGDIANINFVGKVDDVAFEGGSAENFDITVGSGQFIPGFEDQMIGMKKGETKDINVQFPADYHADNLASKDAIFTVSLNSIKKEEKPVLDDAFVAGLKIPNVTTVAQLKEYIEKFLTQQQENEENARIQNQFLDFVSQAKLSFEPKGLKAKLFAQIKQQQFGQLAQYGISMEQYLEMVGENKDKILADLEKQASKQLVITLALAALVKESKIGVTDAEFEQEIQDIAHEYNVSVDIVTKQIPEDVLKSSIKSRKVVDALIKEAQAR